MDNRKKTKPQAVEVLLDTLRALGYPICTGDTMPDRLSYSETDAAKMLSISPRKLFGLRAAGLIKAKKVGTRTLYTHAELLRFLESEGTA